MKIKNKFRFMVFIVFLIFIILFISRIFLFIGHSVTGIGIKTIVVDAGHGDTDPGTTSINGVYEKDIVLDISNMLSKELKWLGYEVIDIRTDDTYIDNKERARIANDMHADLYISIHGNAMENNSDINGVQVLYYTGSRNYDFADIMLQEIIKTTGANDKGVVERDDLIVLNKTNMPALLIETGFLSNLDEAEKLMDKNYRKQIVEGIINGIEKIK